MSWLLPGSCLLPRLVLAAARASRLLPELAAGPRLVTQLKLAALRLTQLKLPSSASSLLPRLSWLLPRLS